MSLDYLKEVLFSPFTPVFEQYLINVLILLGVYVLIAYLATVVLLQTPIYRSKREFIDTDFRVKLGWSLGLVFSMVLITGNTLYIWLKGNYGAINLLAHWTVLGLVFVIWVTIHLSARRAVRTAIKAIL